MINPELRRNLWLELTPQRLIIMPLVLAGALFLVHTFNAPASAPAIASTALFIAGALLFFWGASQASESLLAEIRERTWDGQRMSAMDPWSLAWGKLLGATLFSWYGALMALVVFLFYSDLELLARLRLILIFVLGGIFCQALALMISLHSVRKDRKIIRSQSTALALLSVIVLVQIISPAFALHATAQWYGISLSLANLSLMSIAFFSAWFVTGVYRQTRAELQMANGILVWLGFVISLLFYAAGFIGNHGFVVDEIINGRLLMAFSIATGLLYVMALSEPKDPVTVSRLRRMFADRVWKRIGETLPCWAVTLPVVVVLGLLLVIAGSEKVYTGDIVNVPLFIASATLLVVRDIFFILYLNFARNRKRADISAIFYLVLAYTLIPSLLKAFGLGSLTMLFWPQWDSSVGIGVIVALLEAVAIIWLTARRWQVNYSQA